MTTRVISVTVDGRTTTVRATDPGRVLNVGPSGGGGGGAGTVTSVNEVEPVDGDITLTPDDFTDGTTNHVFTAADDTKLAGISTGATANSSDATLLARANHTGTQAISTVTGLQASLDGKETAGAAAAAQAAAVQRANHTGTQTLATISDAGTAAALNVPASGDATSGQVVKGSDSRLTDARTPTTHSHAESDVTSLVSDLAAKAPLASPALTGNPTAPTQTAGNNSTRLATTAFVTAAVAAGGSGSTDPHPFIFQG